MSRLLEEYDVPYPDRDRPDIQSLIWAKTEFRECVSGPRVTEDKNVSNKYYNMQVFFQRYVFAYRSVLLYFKQSCGKTGAYKCFQEYMKTAHPESVSTFYYFCGRSQINDFNEQVSVTFGTDTAREVFEKVSGTAANGKWIVKVIINKRSTLLRNSLKNEKFSPMTYNKFRKMVDSMSNKEIIRSFGNAALFIDEVQFIKLDEDKDRSIKRDTDEQKKSRNRILVYNAFYRVARLCPDCYFIISTGTPNTNSIKDIIYQINLLPGNERLIWTRVAQSIADEMEAKYGIPQPKQWVKVDLEEKDQDRLEAQLEPILRGRVMYATAPETDAVKTYLTDDAIEKMGNHFPFAPTEEYDVRDWGVIRPGDPENNTFPYDLVSDYDYKNWRRIEYNQDAYRTLSIYTMSDFQSANYLSVHNSNEKVYSDARQASIFVFPSEQYIQIVESEGIEAANIQTNYGMAEGQIGGGFGQKAFNLHCVKRDIKLKEATGTTSYKQRVDRFIPSYRARRHFARYVRDLQNVKNSGIKIYEVVIHALNPKVGPMTVASTFVYITCVLIGVILKVHGFEEYNPEVKNIFRPDDLSPEMKKPRYALLGAWNKGVHQEILRLAGHKDNVRGEYLKLVMITPVSSTGLNIHNQEGLFIIDPTFTEAQLEQSERRVIRPNSHKNSFEWVKKKRGASNFSLFVFYMVAQPSIQMAEEMGIDAEENREWSMYAAMHDKDVQNARIIRALKRIAIDAQANLGRNIRPSIIDYTTESDYVETAYTPYNIDTSLAIDTSTYDSYYATGKLEIPRAKIHDYFMSLPNHSAVTIRDMVAAFEDQYTEVELMIYLKAMVEEQTVPGTDVFGLDVVLNENTDVFYLTREISSVSDPSLEYYSNFLALQSTHTLDSIVSDFLDEEVLEEYMDGIEESDNYRDYISQYVPNAYKSKLLEDAFVQLYSGIEGKDLPLWGQRILTGLWNLHMILTSESGPVVIHQVSSLYDGVGSGTNYNPVDSVLKTSQQLRIMIIRQGLVWQDCTKPEAEEYSKMLNSRFSAELSYMYEEHIDLGCVGIIVRYDAVHIRRFRLLPDGRIQTKGTGKNSRGFKLKNLLPLMYRAATNPEERDLDVSDANEELAHKIIQSMGVLKQEPADFNLLVDYPTEELEYYYSVLKRAINDKEYIPAQHICELLRAKDAIYTVIGDPEATISRIGKRETNGSESESD